MKNMPAFPISKILDYDYNTGKPIYEHYSGLTIREYFAIMTMQGFLAQGIPGRHNTIKELIPNAVEYADALIKELEKELNETKRKEQ